MLWLRGLLFTIVMYAAALAHEAGCPIVPVAHNACDCKPKETNLLVQAWVEDKMNETSSIYKDRARTA